MVYFHHFTINTTIYYYSLNNCIYHSLGWALTYFLQIEYNNVLNGGPGSYYWFNPASVMIGNGLRREVPKFGNINLFEIYDTKEALVVEGQGGRPIEL